VSDPFNLGVFNENIDEPQKTVAICSGREGGIALRPNSVVKEPVPGATLDEVVIGK